MAGLPVTVAGNVGTALTRCRGRSTPRAVVVCEASSFQLEDTLAFAPEAAVLLNLRRTTWTATARSRTTARPSSRSSPTSRPDALAVVPAGLALDDAGGAATRVTFGGRLPRDADLGARAARPLRREGRCAGAASR